MRRACVLLPALATALAGDPAWTENAQPADLRRLFPREAEVSVEREGLSRLVLPAEVMARCRPDLSDLRLFDGKDEEVPFVLDAGARPGGDLEVIQRHESRILEARRSEIGRQDAPRLRREIFDLAMPPDPPRAGAWVLVMHTSPREFVARVTIESIGKGGEAEVLVKDGSLFRLGGPRPAVKDRVPLPPIAGGRLRVVLESEHPFWIEPAFRLESARTLERSGRIAVPLEILSTRREDGRTLVELQRPRGIVPDVLRVETSTGTFDRVLEVSDEGPTGLDTGLGSGRVFRVQALVPVGEQEVELREARGERLRVAIEDGDSPPLADLAFAAVIRQPSLIFSLPPGPTGGAAGIIRFGGGRAHPPRYDLAGLLPQTPPGAVGKRAEVAALLHDPNVVRPARLGTSRSNPVYDGAPALAFAMHPGAEVDGRLFSHRRPITVPDAPEGLSRLRLQPGDLAVLSDDLSDLRVADVGSRQWPYLIEREAASELVACAIEGPEREGGISRYVLRPPVTPLRPDRIVLDTGAGFFDRGFRIEAGSESGAKRTLARGRLTRSIGDRRPVSITVEPARVETLQLIIEDGDDAPLAFQSIQARVVLPDLFLTAPPGPYTVLMGAQGQDAPRYELERVRDVVLAVKAAAIESGSLEANRDFSLRARLAGRGLGQTVLLWTTLVAAVAILVVLTLRLARRDPPRDV